MPAFAVIVQHARNELFAGAGFSVDHHCEVGLRQARQHTVDFLHRDRSTDQRQFLTINVCLFGAF